MMLRNCPTHGLNLWTIIQKIYSGLNFVSRNLLDSAAGGTFMEITLGEATKLLDNIMANYSQWHTQRAPASKKINLVEEISSLSEKVDALVKLVASRSAHDVTLPMKTNVSLLEKYVVPAKRTGKRNQFITIDTIHKKSLDMTQIAPEIQVL